MSFARSANDLVNLLKAWTRNLDQLDQSGDRQLGINESYLLFALNEGKNSIQQAVAVAQPNAFVEPITSSLLTTETISYEIPDLAITKSRVRKVQFSLTTSEQDFRTLQKIPYENLRYIKSDGQSIPLQYAQLGNRIYFAPTPASGYVRIYVQRYDDQLDVRRAKLGASGIASSGGFATEISLDTGLLDSVNKEALRNAGVVCVNSYAGTVQVYNIPISSYDEPNNKLIVEAGVFPYSGGTLAGSYLTIGTNSTTHSKLPRDMEDYVLEWAKYRIENWDASDQVPAEVPILQTHKAQIIDLYSDSADEETPPVFGDLSGDWIGD